MARLFNAYVMVDWSAASAPKQGKDSIWIGVIKRDIRFRNTFEAVNPPTREAAMQARRVWLPPIEGPVEARDAVAWDGAALAEPEGQPPRLDRPVILVGPEGGWSDDERERSAATVALGPHVLRVETAAMAAAAMLVGLRSRLVRPA